MKPAFHEGELAAQRLAGQLAAGHGIRDFMPEQHRSFFEALPFVLAASVDADGAPRAQVLHGAPGFVASPDPLTLELACEPAYEPAYEPALEPGVPIGLLGIDFATRRRNRANGVVRANGDGKLVVAVRESFGNCPKYITLRDVAAAPRQPLALLAFDGLHEAARALISTADTFFIATGGSAHGVDISHRGGTPGFVRIDGDTLVVPDFDGNRYFNTLGNLLLDARAALLIIDFTTGDVLTLRGTTQISWRERAREWRFCCAGGTLARAALPLRWHAR